MWRNFCYLLFLLPVIYGTPHVQDMFCTCGSDSWILSEWTGGAEFQLKIPITNAVSGWTMLIRFDQAVYDFQIWDGIIVGSSSHQITVEHQWYNENLSPGATVQMNCILSYSGAKPSPPDIQFSGQQICDCDGGGGDPQPPATQPPPGTGPYNYGEVLMKSILFYEAQRSGDLPSNNRVDFRGDSALGDGSDVGLDLTGGWYDAGDHVKFGFPLASTATILAWGLIEYQAAYQHAGQLGIMQDSLKWVTDYFMKCHSSRNELYIQVGDGNADHAFWGRPEEMTMARPSIKVTTSLPGSDVAGETAAALAAASIAFKNNDPIYSNNLLQHARELYDFANNYRGIYSDSIPDVKDFYGSTGYGDELAWAAAWLYSATKDSKYLTAAEKHYNDFNLNGPAWAFSWDDKKAGVQVLLYKETSKSTYGSSVTQFLDSWLPGGGITYTPKGLAWRDKWGPNRYAANSAFLALLAADAGLKTSTYRDFATSQINYMLGDGGRSYVVGFGHDAANAPHHRSSSCRDLPAPCNWDDYNAGGPNPQVLNGALVGGPDANDNFYNDRTDYIMNEVACDYNAGFQSAVAGIYALYM